MTTLYCEKCGKVCVEIKDGKFRNGIVVICDKCKPKPNPYDIPDFLSGLMNGKHK